MSRSSKDGVLRLFVGSIGRTIGLSALAVGCGTPTQSVSADAPRSSAPLPACLLRLPQRGEAQRGSLRQLSEPVIWKAVFPSYDENQGLESNALACTGRAVFSDPQLSGGHPRRPWPITAQTGDILYGSGPKRSKVVWFRTHAWDDGTAGGALALVRAEEDHAEVFGIGTYRGSFEKTRLATERMADDVVITATDDGCQGASPDDACESWVTVYSPWAGNLVEQARIATERRRFVAGGEPGAQGPVRYRLVSTPQYEAEAIQLLEQITAIDSTGRTLRTVELQRAYQRADGAWTETQPSLWTRIVPEAAGGASGSTEADHPPTDQAEPSAPASPNRAPAAPASSEQGW